MSIRFDTAAINPIGRVTSGVKGINLADDDKVVCGFPILDKTKEVAVIGKNGYGKKSPLSEFTLQGRGGKGLKIGQELAGAALIGADDSLLLVGKPNSICIGSEELPSQGRATVGVKLVQNEIKNVVIL